MPPPKPEPAAEPDQNRASSRKTKAVHTDPERVRVVGVRVNRTMTVSMNPNLQAFLRVLAEKEDRNLSRVVERLLKKGLAAEGIPFDEETSP